MGIENTVYLTIGCPVVLTLNLYSEGGLFNSATGVVQNIIYGENEDELPPYLPKYVMVKFKNLSINGFNNIKGLIPIPLVRMAS